MIYTHILLLTWNQDWSIVNIVTFVCVCGSIHLWLHCCWTAVVCSSFHLVSCYTYEFIIIDKQLCEYTAFWGMYGNKISWAVIKKCDHFKIVLNGFCFFNYIFIHSWKVEYCFARILYSRKARVLMTNGSISLCTSHKNQDSAVLYICSSAYLCFSPPDVKANATMLSVIKSKHKTWVCVCVPLLLEAGLVYKSTWEVFVAFQCSHGETEESSCSCLVCDDGLSCLCKPSLPL